MGNIDISRLSEFIYKNIDMTKPLMQLSVDLALAIDQEFGHYLHAKAGTKSSAEHAGGKS